jgi:hypothetical protein
MRLTIVLSREVTFSTSSLGRWEQALMGEARPLVDLSDFHPAELADFRPALTADHRMILNSGELWA